ncbi:MAG: DUF3316 domain-containing protein [Bacteroidaceae bacterium]|nr:DUF3316 domain-containing protein [Bacteroidaceae bacterium]
MKKILLFILLIACSRCFAQSEVGERAELNHTIGVAVGATNILDTYLSPEEYTGEELRLLFDIRSPRGEWSHLFHNELSLSSVQNRAETATELAGMYRFRYALEHDLNLLNVENLSIRAGGHATANLGFLYNMRNGNNPAQGKLGVNVGPIVHADYVFRLFQKRFSAHYEALTPLLGLMFSPNYGQSYYEIFSRGNYDSNCVPTTIFSTPSFRQQLTLEVPIGKKALCIGYLGDYDQYKVNNLKYHNYTHAIMIGLTY